MKLNNSIAAVVTGGASGLGEATARALAAKIAALEVSIARRVGENEILFGSVTSGDLADALAARDVAVDKRKILLGEPLKTVGDHVVPVKLHRDITAELKVKVVAAQ